MTEIPNNLKTAMESYADQVKKADQHSATLTFHHQIDALKEDET